VEQIEEKQEITISVVFVFVYFSLLAFVGIIADKARSWWLVVITNEGPFVCDMKKREGVVSIRMNGGKGRRDWGGGGHVDVVLISISRER